MLLAAALVGGVLGLAVTLVWDMWRHPRSRWAEEARADIGAARAAARAAAESRRSQS